MRAKKIENEPIVNEVVSDDVEIRKMKKKIVSLETELKVLKASTANKASEEEMQKELKRLKLFIIQSAQSNVNHNKTDRRKTWNGGQSMIPLHTSKPDRDIAAKNATANRGMHFAAPDGDDEWYDSFPEMPTEAKPTFKIPEKVPPKRSLLAMPTASFKSPVHRTTCKFTDSSNTQL